MNGTGSVFYRKSRKKFVAQVYREGKVVQREAPTEAEASLLLAQLLRGEDTRPQQTETAPTVSVWIATWLQSRQERKDIRPHSYACYRSRLRHVVDALGAERLDRLRPLQIQRFYDQLLAGGMEPDSLLAVHRALMTCLREAEDLEVIARNPAKRVRVPAPSPPREDYLEPAQLQALLAVSEGTRWHALWAVMGTMGLRVGEATALLWGDIDFRRETLTVARTMTVGWEGEITTGPPKTPRSHATLYLSTRARAALGAHKTIIAGLGFSWGTDAPVFPGDKARVVSHQVVTTALEGDCARAGLARITPHVLRHTAATLALLAGVDPHVRRDVMRHTRVEMTGRYSHVNDTLRRAAVAAVDALLDAAG